MSQALYRTWRPALWDEVVGQDHIVQTLRNAITTGRVGHAYLFAGPRGTGKTTSARLLAKAVNCLDENLGKRPCNSCANCLAVNEGRFLDLIEIDAASNTSVDDIRDLRDKVNFSPSQGRFKVYIIDEVHMLSTSAFNALLKTLEEPPAHVIFILATTELHKIPATVLSRCQRHEFRRIPVPVIVAKLKELTKKEKIKIDDDALNLVARQATGAMRDAISLVDQLSSINEHITLKDAQEILGTATSQAVIDLVDAMQARESGQGLNIIHQALDSGTDARQFARQVVEYLRNLLVVKLKAGSDLDLAPEQLELMQKQAEGFEILQLTQMIAAFSNAATDLKANWHPGLGLEMAYTSSILEVTQPANPAAALEPAVQHPSHNKTPKQRPAAQRRSTQKTLPQGANASEAIPEPSGPIDLELVRSRWDQIKKAVRAENLMTNTLLNSGKLIAADESKLVLNFSSDLLRERMMDEKNIKVLQNVLQKLLGKALNVSCTVGTQNLPTEGSSLVEPGGLVDRVQRELGATVRKIEKKNEE